MFRLPSLTKIPQTVLADGRSEISLGPEVCDACPSCTSAKGNYHIYDIVVKKFLKCRMLGQG